MLEYATALNVGKATEHQEDGFFLDPDRELFGVFDSMGGHRTGYIALEAAAKISNLSPNSKTRSGLKCS